MAVRAFRFLKTCHALEALRRQDIKVSRFDDLNDPFELYGIDLADRRYRRMFKDFKRWASQRFGLLCFSRGWRNPLLWSHYGDRHNGVALEFQIDEDLVCEVRYTTNRLRMDIKKALARGSAGEEEAYQMAITKAHHWQYEEEIRIFLALSQCRERDGLLFEPLTDRMRIVGIVLGPLCSLKKADVQKSLPIGSALDVTWTRLAYTSFNVVHNQAKKPRVVRGT